VTNGLEAKPKDVAVAGCRVGARIICSGEEEASFFVGLCKGESGVRGVGKLKGLILRLAASTWGCQRVLPMTTTCGSGLAERVTEGVSEVTRFRGRVPAVSASTFCLDDRRVRFRGGSICSLGEITAFLNVFVSAVLLAKTKFIHHALMDHPFWFTDIACFGAFLFANTHRHDNINDTHLPIARLVQIIELFRHF